MDRKEERRNSAEPLSCCYNGGTSGRLLCRHGDMQLCRDAAQSAERGEQNAAKNSVSPRAGTVVFGRITQPVALHYAAIH